MAEPQKTNNPNPVQNIQKEIKPGSEKAPKKLPSDKERPRKFSVRKRPPPKEYNRPNDLYIGERSNFECQLVKCRKLLDGEEYKEIFLHGLGKAIPKTLNLAEKVKNIYLGTVDFSVNTSTVKLIDDLIPLDSETQVAQQHRITSTVIVRIYRTINIP